MKKKLLSVAILSAVTTTAYAANWNDVQQSFDVAPTTSVIQDVREAIVDQVQNKDTVTFSTDAQTGANNEATEALSSNVTSTDWLKDLKDDLAEHELEINSLQGWTGAGGFSSALDLHTQLSNDIDVVDTDLQTYKVDTDEELNRHETALQAATTYTGTLASAMTATADSVAANSIGSAQIKNGSVKSSDIKDGSIKSRDIKDGAVGNDQLARNAVTSDKVLDGSLTGDDVADGGLTGVDLADESIDGTKVTGLTGADVTDGTLTGDDIQDGSLTGTDVAAESLNGSHVTNLTGDDITDGSLTGMDVQDGSITGLDVADNSLTGNDVLDASLELGDLSSAAQSSLSSSGGGMDSEYVKAIMWFNFSGLDTGMTYADHPSANHGRYWRQYVAVTVPFEAKFAGKYTFQYVWGDGGCAVVNPGGDQEPRGRVGWTRTFDLQPGDRMWVRQNGAGNDQNMLYLNGKYIQWNTYAGNYYYACDGLKVTKFMPAAPSPF